MGQGLGRSNRRCLHHRSFSLDVSDDAPEHRTTVAEVKGGILATGGAFGQSAEFGELVERLGVGFWPTYFAARSGAMGNVGPETVAAVLGFFSPDHVAQCLAASVPAGMRSQIAAEDIAAMDRWGQRVFGDIADVGRAAQLAERVVAGADPSALPLFAGLRSVVATKTGTDPGARLARALMCLREHRGGLYLLAIRSVGLSPLEAILVQGGEQKAFANGWRPPFAVASGATERRAQAERLADTLAAGAYATLSTSENDELAATIIAVEVALRD